MGEKDITSRTLEAFDDVFADIVMLCLYLIIGVKIIKVKLLEIGYMEEGQLICLVVMLHGLLL